MIYKIDEEKILDWAKNKLPDVNSFKKQIVVVYVNDFIGETDIIRENRYWNIESSDGELIIIDKKEKTYYYYVVFQKSIKDNIYYWDFIGYNKVEIINI